MKLNPLKDQALVIFGASGDLTYRKLIPAIFDIYKQKALPENYAILGVSRSSISDEAFRVKMSEGIRKFSMLKPESDDELSDFCKRLFYLSIDTDNQLEYAKLKDRLSKLDIDHKTSGNYIFYLSTPPILYTIIPNYLAEQGLNKAPGKIRRIIIEKPFGTDLESAISLNKLLKENYAENQIFRIDHYLGKETVQNLLVTRFANSIYEPLWNRNYIHHVEITAAESIGVEDRGAYYDNSGALKDMVQNHLFQLLALVAMEPPMAIDAESIRNEKLKVFQAMRPLSIDDMSTFVRGQYLAAKVNGTMVNGYREEKNVAPNSQTETFLAMKVFIDNWRWSDVPFYIRTGKRLPTRVSEIVIHFRSVPQRLFGQIPEPSNEDNQLIIRIQPDEGILLKTKIKVPGKGYMLDNVNVDFHYAQLKNVYLPDAYERLLQDCMAGDATLYIHGDALECTWKYLQPLLDYWKNNQNVPLYGYPAGTWGPKCSDDLIQEKNLTWRYPCKNLSDDGIYCEL